MEMSMYYFRFDTVPLNMLLATDPHGTMGLSLES